MLSVAGRIRPFFYRALIVACFAAPPSQAGQAADEALLLQQRGTQRIDRYVEHVRRAGDAQAPRGELERALSELAASSQAFMRRGALAQAALSLHELGTVERLRGQWLSASTHYREALDLARKANHANYQVKALLGLVRVYLRGLRDYTEAASHLEEALRLGPAGVEPRELFDRYDLKSALHDARGELVAAAEASDRAFAVAKEMNTPEQLFYAHFGRGSVYSKLASNCDIKRGAAPCYEALDRARRDLEQALAVAKNQGYAYFAGLIDGSLRGLERRRENFRQEETSLGITAKYKIFHPKRPGDVLVSEEFFSRDRVFPPGSEPLVREMIRKYSGDAIGYHIEGLFKLNLGQEAEAFKAFLKAVELLEADRRRLSDESGRGAFLEDKIEIYYTPLLYLLQARRRAQAFDLLERSRARALADALQTQELGLAQPADRKFYAEALQINARLSQLQKELFNLRSATDPGRGAGRVAAAEQEVQRLEGDYRRLQQGVVAAGSKLQELVVSRPVPLADLQQVMKRENFEVLTYLVLKEQVVLWHLSGEAVNVRSIFLTREELVGKVSSLRRSLVDPAVKFDEQTARELFLFLIQPALGWIKSERLVIVPHDDLNYVPFQAFQDPADGRFLGERFDISYAPSATVLMGLKPGAGIRGGRLLAAADPEIGAARREVLALGRLYPTGSKLLSGELVKEADVKAWAGDYDLIHLSVHGVFVAQEPLLSHLRLGPGGAEDGKLTAAEMFGLPLAGARLIVLSACDTGQARATRANEVSGMVRSLLYAGANTLVLSSWAIDADSTALWMETFYREAQSRPPAGAARLAIAAVRRDPRYSHPYYWAPFLLTGR